MYEKILNLLKQGVSFESALKSEKISNSDLRAKLSDTQNLELDFFQAAASSRIGIHYDLTTDYFENYDIDGE